MTGVGIDVVEIDRFAAVLARRPGLEEHLFTPAEREYAAARPRPVQHLAARFCAKEAVVKALRPPAWDWHDIAILPAARVALSGPVAEPSGPGAARPAVQVSLTHGETIAAAIAVAE